MNTTTATQVKDLTKNHPQDNTAKPKVLQTAVAAAVNKANSSGATLKVSEGLTLLNTRRKIYDTLLDFNVPFLVSEMQQHLEPFGYNPATVAATVSQMYSKKMLTRTQKSPYAYSLVPDCPKPDEGTFTYSPDRKSMKQKKDEQKQARAKEFELPKKPIKKVVETSSPVAGLKALTHISDKTLDREYEGFEQDVDVLIEYFLNLKKDMAKVRQMAAVVRAMNN